MAKKKARKTKRKQREKERAEREQQWQLRYQERAKVNAKRKAEQEASHVKVEGWTSEGRIDSYIVDQEQRKQLRRTCEEALEMVRKGTDANKVRISDQRHEVVKCALSGGLADICAELVYEHGANSYACDGAVLWAGRGGNVETMRLALQFVDDALGDDWRSDEQARARLAEHANRAVFEAVLTTNAGEDVLGLLKLAGANLDALHEVGEVKATPLNAAVNFGRTRSVRALLKLGADDMIVPPAVSDVSRTVLELASEDDDKVRVELAMLEHYLGRKIVSEEDLVHACDAALQQGKYTMAMLELAMCLNRLRPSGGANRRQVVTATHATRIAHAAAREGIPLEGDVLAPVHAAAVKTNWVASILQALDASRQPEPRTPAVCFLWSKYGLCKYGDACLFAHAESSRPADPPSAPFQHASSAVRAQVEDLAELREVLEPHVVEGVFSS